MAIIRIRLPVGNIRSYFGVDRTNGRFYPAPGPPVSPLNSGNANREASASGVWTGRPQVERLPTQSGAYAALPVVAHSVEPGPPSSKLFFGAPEPR